MASRNAPVSVKTLNPANHVIPTKAELMAAGQLGTAQSQAERRGALLC
jgi:hypothetical protein